MHNYPNTLISVPMFFLKMSVEISLVVPVAGCFEKYWAPFQDGHDLRKKTRDI